MKTKMTQEDLIEREARKVARDRLERHLAIENLPLPKESALELHITQLIAADPTIMVEAERNVDARTDAYTQSLQNLGLIAPPLDVEIEL